MTQICLLGEQAIRPGPDEPPIPVPGRAGALLAALVLHEGVHQQRVRLASVLWPCSAAGQARTNLRRELHHLRSLLGPVPSLVVSASALAWRDDEDCHVDVLGFRAADGRPSRPAGTGTRARA